MYKHKTNKLLRGLCVSCLIGIWYISMLDTLRLKIFFCRGYNSGQDYIYHFQLEMTDAICQAFGMTLDSFDIKSTPFVPRKK